MNITLNELCRRVRGYPGLTRKKPIADLYRRLVLEGPPGPQLPNYGDDAAAIPDEGGYLLLAADGIMTGLLVNEPYAAGKAAVMVTVNDIYAMGGRPLALVNVLASGVDGQRAEIVAGLSKGCHKLRVPMVGGHLHPDAPAETPHLSVAILGRAEKVIHGFGAMAGDNLIFAADLTGRAGCRSVVSWDANSGKTTDELLFRLEALPLIAREGLATAAKDVSNAGLLGTLSIMMENSGLGADLDLEAVPCPDSLGLEEWAACFQSFGFVLAAPPERSPRVIEIFAARNITAAVIGRVRGDRRVTLHHKGQSAELFDFSRDLITGVTRPASWSHPEED